MGKASYLRKGACVVATAALAGAMVPAAALATDQTSTGGTSEVTSSSVQVVYEKDCSWTATYPTSVTLTDGTGDAAGTASATISFNVKGLIDVDHQVTITPTSTSVTLTGERHQGTLAATITAPSSAAAASAVNSDACADISATASATIDSTLAVDTYKGTTTFKIQCAESSGCLAAGTLVAMGDGTLCAIEDISAGDEVLTFNHETGSYESQPVFFAYTGKGTRTAFTLAFADGTTVTVVGAHGLFEQDAMKYVTLDYATAQSSVGKSYYNAATGEFTELASVEMASEPVTYYCLYTDHNYNCVANGMLTVPDDSEAILNIYEFGAGLRADMGALARDIATYGLYALPEERSAYRERYEKGHGEYASIVVGKGLATWDEIFASLEEVG